MNIKKITDRKDWNDKDAKQLIALWFQFMSFQVNAEKYQKAAPVRLLAELQGRSKGSIEAKLMNVSAVMVKNGHAFVKGYKPLSNYNRELESQVLKFMSK